MDNTDDLRLLLASRYPLIVAEQRDETRFLDLARRAASQAGLRLWRWSVTRGLAADGGEPLYNTLEALKALDFITGNSLAGVFVFCDASKAMADDVFVRRLKEMAQQPGPGVTIVIASAEPTLPPELDGVALRWSLKPPDAGELKTLVDRTLADLAARGIGVLLDASHNAQLVDALRGLSVMEAERLIQQAAMNDGRVDSTDVAFVRARKANMIGADGLLELIEADNGTLDAVGGLSHLKQWLALRGRALDVAAARAFGIEPPRGALVTGVPGCGKSLVAKTLARTWGLPLLLLDPSRLYGPYVGESEQRLRDALDGAEAMTPGVLWIDEIEKGFASGGAGDGGVSKRLLGTFLRWMQDRPDGIFVIATCNDVTALPAELERKGRFDEIFFVDLPDPAEREEIFRLQLQRRRRDPNTFDLTALKAAADGFSGSEIEAAIVGALYRAFSAGGELTTAEILAELSGTAPLSVTRAEDITRLRAWAAGRAVRASGPASSPAVA